MRHERATRRAAHRGRDGRGHAAPGRGAREPDPADHRVRAARWASRSIGWRRRTGSPRWRRRRSAGKIQVDVDTGVYGHKVTMADYSPGELARFRAMAPIVGIPDSPPEVTTALALSGSAAQSKIQRFPADADFFERVHIRAATREEAIERLGRIIRDKALETFAGPGYRLWEVKWGEHDEAGMVRGEEVHPRSWHLVDARRRSRRGVQELVRPDGSVRRIEWDAAPDRPGWSKLDWVIADAYAGHPGQRVERARSHLGGARRHDRAARRVPGPVLPGGLPGDRFHPAVQPARQAAGCGRGGRLRGPARARGLEVHGQAAQLRQGRAPHVQRVPAHRALPRGGVPAGAVRRAGDRALPGGRAAGDRGRCGGFGRVVRPGAAAVAGGPTDHGLDRCAGGPGRGGDGGEAQRVPRGDRGARGRGGAGGARGRRARWPRWPRSTTTSAVPWSWCPPSPPTSTSWPPAPTRLGPVRGPPRGDSAREPPPGRERATPRMARHAGEPGARHARMAATAVAPGPAPRPGWPATGAERLPGCEAGDPAREPPPTPRMARQAGDPAREPPPDARYLPRLCRAPSTKPRTAAL